MKLKNLMSKVTMLTLVATPLIYGFSLSTYDNTMRFNLEEAKTADKYKVINDLPYWEKSAAELQRSYDRAIKKANASLDKLALIKKSSLTFLNTVAALDDIYYEVDLIGNRAGLLGSTSLVKEVRKKATEIETAISNWYVDASSRKDIYLQVKSFSDDSLQTKMLSPVETKLLKDTLREYQRVGFHLPDSTQLKIKALKKELSQLKATIDENIKIAGNKKIIFTPEEMKGMPPEELDALSKEGGKYIAKAGVTYQVYAVLKNSPIEAVRMKALTGRNQRAMQTNNELTTKVVKKRAELAQLLGYKTWADYKTEVKMAKTGATALAFVDDLIQGLEPKFRAEMETLRQLKATETGNANAVLESWDVRYYQKILAKKLFNLDMSALKKYFSYDTTLKGMFKVFEKIFKLKIDSVKAPYVWAKEVEMIRISDSTTGKPLGFLYLDMFPRPEEEKYGHFAMFTVRSGKLLSNGKYRRPIAALVCNFPQPQGGNPSLLDFGQVETLFHEFGHALHGIVTESRFAQFAGTRVARDFVEAPSQMLESWVNDKKVLDTFAVNYQNPADKFPADALTKIQASGLATVATFYRRQLAFGKMDLMLHQNISPTQNFDIAGFTNKVMEDVYFAFPANTAMINSFGHLWGGYDAGYYGYAWADNLAADMTSKFETAPDGFLDVQMGMKLREEIYQVGATRDITFSIESFLGRKPNSDAFLKKLGIGKN